jgi:hypothetical protein
LAEAAPPGMRLIPVFDSGYAREVVRLYRQRMQIEHCFRK